MELWTPSIEPLQLKANIGDLMPLLTFRLHHMMSRKYMAAYFDPELLSGATNRLHYYASHC